MHPALQVALTEIQAQRPGQPPDGELFGAVENLVRSLGEQDLAERILSYAGPDVPLHALSSLLDALAWHTNDNGAEVHRTVEQWLREGTDERRVVIALGVEEFYPFLAPAEMKTVLAGVALRYPATKERCAHLVQSRSASEA